MAFVKVDKGPRGLSYGNNEGIRMGAHLQSKVGTTRGLYFSIADPVIDQVGWSKKRAPTDKRDACRVDVQEGVGEDAGFLLLTESESGYALGTTNSHAMSFSMSVSVVKLKHYVLNEVPHPTEPVEFTVDEKDKTILIQCPDWLRYNSLSYNEPPKSVVEDKRAVPPTRAVLRGELTDIAKTLKDELPNNRKQRRAIVAAAAKAMQ